MTEHDDDHTDTDTDTEILEAYARLGGSLAPTGDPLPGVRRAVRRRHVVRRAVAAAGVLAVVAGVGGAVALHGGGGGDDAVAVDEPSAAPSPSPTETAAPTGPASTLTFTHRDGSAYLFDASTLSLACSTDKKSGASTLTLTTTEPKLDQDGETLLAPLLYVEVRTDLVQPGQSFTVPYELSSGNSEGRPMTFFFATPEGGKRANELSSAESDGSGTVTIDTATCGPTPELALSIDAALGSELRRQAPMAIAGSYHS